MADDRKSISRRHSIIMEQRERVNVTGVIEVISFDEEAIVAETDVGILVVRGINLHVNKLNLENGELNIDGDVDAILYEDEGLTKARGKSFLSKVFR